MKPRSFTFALFLLNTFLFATTYSVSKEALQRIDPIVFTFFMMVTLLPLGVGILLLSWPAITKGAMKSGFVLGSCQCLGLFMIYISLKYNTAASTAFFPSLNGFLAALMAWIFLRLPIRRATWFAGTLSVAGALLIITSSSMGAARGACIAFIGGLFCTLYVFLADREQSDARTQWPLLGVQLLTMSAWASLIVLLFGDWSAVHPQLPKDIGVILYIGVICTFLPTLITVLAQQYISPLTVTFIYILEPILGALVAYLYLGETLSLVGYAGGGLIVLGALVQALGSRGADAASSEQGTTHAPRALYVVPLQHQAQRPVPRLHGRAFIHLALLLGASIALFLGQGGFPPASWRALFHYGPSLIENLQQGPSDALLLLLAQSVCWLLARVSLLALGAVMLSHALRTLRRPLAVRQSPLDTRALRQMNTTALALQRTSTAAVRGAGGPIAQGIGHYRHPALMQAWSDWDDGKMIEEIYQDFYAEMIPNHIQEHHFRA